MQAGIVDKVKDILAEDIFSQRPLRCKERSDKRCVAASSAIAA